MRARAAAVPKLGKYRSLPLQPASTVPSDRAAAPAYVPDFRRICRRPPGVLALGQDTAQRTASNAGNHPEGIRSDSDDDGTEPGVCAAGAEAAVMPKSQCLLAKLHDRRVRATAAQ